MKLRLRYEASPSFAVPEVENEDGGKEFVRTCGSRLVAFCSAPLKAFRIHLEIPGQEFVSILGIHEDQQ